MVNDGFTIHRTINSMVGIGWLQEPRTKNCSVSMELIGYMVGLVFHQK
jgi:hypothetical protein